MNLSQTPPSPENPETEDLQFFTFGPAHTELGFEEPRLTSDFLKSCFLLGVLSINTVKREDLNERQQAKGLMATSHLHPAQLQAAAQKEPSKELLDRLSQELGQDAQSNYAFFEMRDRMEFPANQVLVLKAFAEFVRKENVRPEEYIEMRKELYRFMKEESKKRGCMPGCLRTVFGVIILGAIMVGGTAGAIAKWNPSLFKDLKDRLAQELPPEAQRAVKEFQNPFHGDIAPSTSGSASGPPDPSTSPETIPESTPERAQETELERRKRETIELFERHFQDHPQQKQICLGLIRRISDGENVSDEEINRVLNPNGLTQEGLTQMEQAWSAPDIQATPEEVRQSLQHIAFWRQRLAVIRGIRIFRMSVQRSK